MPVSELLARTTSRELARWQAYERAQGRLAGGYRDEVLAEICDRLGELTHLMLVVHSDARKRNEIPDPVPIRRPGDLYDNGGR